MRDYSKVSPLFWTRGSGRRLRGSPNAQLVGLYLVTCPSANMIGIFYLPLVTIQHETGLDAEEVEGALETLSEAGFAFYDETAELAWVPNMASYQIGDKLGGEGDKRRAGVMAEVMKVGNHHFLVDFWKRYQGVYGLAIYPFEAPAEPPQTPSKRKPLISEEQEQEQEQEQEHSATTAAADAGPGVGVVKSKRGTRIPADWKPDSKTIAWATEDEGIVDVAAEVAPFIDFWIGVAGQKGVKLDWEGTFRNRLRDLKRQNKLTTRPKAAPKPAPPPVPTPEGQAAVKAVRDAIAAQQPAMTQASFLAQLNQATSNPLPGNEPA